MIALVATAWADAPEDFRAGIEQARFFARKGWWVDARRQLELVVASENGRLDPEAWMLLATTAFQLCDVPAARHAADRAHSNSRDLDQAAQAAALRDWLDQQFGTVVVDAPYEGVRSSIDIELTSTLFDPELKLYLSRVRERIPARAALPLALALPVGSYRINGVAVDVAPGATATVSPRAGAGALQAAQVELGFGPTFWLGRDARGLLPVPSTVFGLSVPAGPLHVGGFAGWTPQAFGPATGGVRWETGGYEVGARIGVEPLAADPLHVRTSIAYAWGVVPGVSLACTGGTCGDAEPADLYVHLPARVHQPRAELAVLFLDHRRGTALGGGLLAQVGGAFGTVRDGGEAVSVDGAAWTYTVPDPSFAAWSVRGLATLTATF